jgi:hypothetical protein
MSTHTFEQLGPVLVSELPPVRAVRLTLAARVRDALSDRLQERAFERALHSAGHAESSDLIALSRRG